jgi:hypothetical protein
MFWPMLALTGRTRNRLCTVHSVSYPVGRAAIEAIVPSVSIHAAVKLTTRPPGYSGFPLSAIFVEQAPEHQHPSKARQGPHARQGGDSRFERASAGRMLMLGTEMMPSSLSRLSRRSTRAVSALSRGVWYGQNLPALRPGAFVERPQRGDPET